MHWHDQALWFVREKEIEQVNLPEWEQLRELCKIK